MSNVTALLLRVYRCDQRIDGLQTRLRAAERYLGEQQRQVDRFEREHESIRSQLRQTEASVANEEVEIAGLDEKIAQMKTNLNEASNPKQYQAFLVQLKSYEAKKAEHDARTLSLMEQAEGFKSRLTELEQKSTDQSRLRDNAADDRHRRAEEIREKLDELKAEREQLAGQVPADAMKIYEDLRELHGEDAMAPLEIVDAKRHEYNCGLSMMAVPIETASSLMQGKLTLSPNAPCILYLPEEVAAEAAVAGGKR